MQRNIFCISSGKGGVGKTSIAINISYALTDLGKSVLLIDGDLGLANIDVMLGLVAKKNIKDVLDGNLTLNEILINIKENLSILPASSGVVEMVNLSFEGMGRIENLLRLIVKDYDLTIIDSSAGIGTSVLSFNAFSNFNIVIVTPEPTSITDAYALIKILKKDDILGLPLVLVNRVKDEKEAHLVFDGLNKALERFLNLNATFLGWLPHSNEINKAIMEQKPFYTLYPNSICSKNIREIAARLIDLMTIT